MKHTCIDGNTGEVDNEVDLADGASASHPRDNGPPSYNHGTWHHVFPDNESFFAGDDSDDEDFPGLDELYDALDLQTETSTEGLVHTEMPDLHTMESPMPTTVQAQQEMPDMHDGCSFNSPCGGC